MSLISRPYLKIFLILEYVLHLSFFLHLIQLPPQSSSVWSKPGSVNILLNSLGSIKYGLNFLTVSSKFNSSFDFFNGISFALFVTFFLFMASVGDDVQIIQYKLSYKILIPILNPLEPYPHLKKTFSDKRKGIWGNDSLICDPVSLFSQFKIPFCLSHHQHDLA